MDKQICLNDISLLPLQLEGICFISQAQWYMTQFNPYMKDMNKLSINPRTWTSASDVITI